MHFLTSFNEVKFFLRSQILSIDHSFSITEAFYLIIQKENQKKIRTLGKIKFFSCICI